MRIVVVGAGGVGTFYGALLARGGQEVTFVARGAQLDALRTRGVHLSSAALGEIDVPPPPAVASLREVREPDLVLLCVKAHQTAALLDDLDAAMGARTVVMALQNGADPDAPLVARLGPARVLSAVVYVNATLEAPGVVHHHAAGLLVIGARPGADASRLPEVREALAVTGLPVRVADDVDRQRWHKLTFNASVNAISALTLRTPRDLLGVPDTRALVVGVMQEVAAVARACGVTVGDDEIRTLVAATEAAAPIRPSMLVDRERGRGMETDALVGAVVRVAAERGVDVPRVRTLHALLLGLDAPVVPTADAPPMAAVPFD
jgi:2-dehydropantoate 2-reductase